MKTTVNIADPLFERAKQHARKTGRSLRDLVEEGLRKVLEADASPAAYRLPDCSFGTPGGTNPLDATSWSELRAEIYGGRK